MRRLSLDSRLVDPAHFTRLEVRRLPGKRPELSQRDNGIAVFRPMVVPYEPGCVPFSECRSQTCTPQRDVDIPALNLDLDLWLHLLALPAWGGAYKESPVLAVLAPASIHSLHRGLTNFLSARQPIRPAVRPWESRTRCGVGQIASDPFTSADNDFRDVC